METCDELLKYTVFFLACLHFPIVGTHRLSESWQSLTLPSLSTSSNLMSGRPTSCYPTLIHSFLRLHIILPTLLLLLSSRIPTFSHVIPFPFTDVPIFPLASFQPFSSTTFLHVVPLPLASPSSYFLPLPSPSLICHPHSPSLYFSPRHNATINSTYPSRVTLST